MKNLTLLKGRDLLTLLDYSRQEVVFMLETAKWLKEMYYSGKKYYPILKGRCVMLIFEKPSTRTRVSLEVAASQLGMHVIYANPQELQLGRGETLEDTARTLSRYVDVIIARVYSHETLEKLAQYSSIPVINALSDKFHPLQALADAFTLWEITGELSNVVLAYVGDGDNNVAHSLLVIGSILGWEVRIVSPKPYQPCSEILEKVLDKARQSGAKIIITEDLNEGVKNVDAIYTDVWVSMGMESEAEVRRKVLEKYRITSKVMELAGKNAIFMHCLPAHRGEEVTDEVIDSERSIVWQQAENRLHTAKAVLTLLTP